MIPCFSTAVLMQWLCWYFKCHHRISMVLLCSFCCGQAHCCLAMSGVDAELKGIMLSCWRLLPCLLLVLSAGTRVTWRLIFQSDSFLWLWVGSLGSSSWSCLSILLTGQLTFKSVRVFLFYSLWSWGTHHTIFVVHISLATERLSSSAVSSFFI